MNDKGVVLCRTKIKSLLVDRRRGRRIELIEESLWTGLVIQSNIVDQIKYVTNKVRH